MSTNSRSLRAFGTLCAVSLFAVAVVTNLTVAVPASASRRTCRPAHTFPTVHKGQLTVAVYASPPYTIPGPGGLYVGVDGLIIKKIAAMECLTLREQAVAGAAVIETVISKRADMAMGGVYYTAQRAHVLTLTNAIYRDGMAFLSKSGIGTISAAKSKHLSVGVIQGYLWDAQFQHALGTGNVKIYPDSSTLVEDLLTGRVDIGVFTTSEGAYRAKQHKGLKSVQVKPDKSVPDSVGASRVIFPLTKGNLKMRNAFNADIKTLLKNGGIVAALKANGLSPTLAGPGK